MDNVLFLVPAQIYFLPVTALIFMFVDRPLIILGLEIDLSS